VGEITTVGLDIGATSGGKMSWAVLTPTEGPQRGALAGDYVGASGQVAVGVGVGGNVLVGGSNRSVTLQPFSVEGDTGINLAVGVSGMVLRPAQ
jgi:mRNA-degrading endonuclease toxin of MazEF toxin-antitoxin module